MTTFQWTEDEEKKPDLISFWKPNVTGVFSVSYIRDVIYFHLYKCLLGFEAEIISPYIF
jgi:hypothetical protein